MPLEEAIKEVVRSVYAIVGDSDRLKKAPRHLRVYGAIYCSQGL